jgi:hypothetical protein
MVPSWIKPLPLITLFAIVLTSLAIHSQQPTWLDAPATHDQGKHSLRPSSTFC